MKKKYIYYIKNNDSITTTYFLNRYIVKNTIVIRKTLIKKSLVDIFNDLKIKKYSLFIIKYLDCVAL